MWNYLVCISTWAETNSGQIQILIALLAIYYVQKQISLFNKQRIFEMRLKLIDFLYLVLEDLHDVENKMIEVKLISNKIHQLETDYYKRVKKKITAVVALEEKLNSSKTALETMIEVLSGNDKNFFSINELEIHLTNSLNYTKIPSDLKFMCDQIILLADYEVEDYDG